MRAISVFITLFFLISTVWGQQSMPVISVSTLEGGSYSTSTHSGKKLLVITLPIVHTSQADSILSNLNALSNQHADSLKVIGVVSIEDGYTSSQSTGLLEWYRGILNNEIVITGGIYTHKSSGGQQHALLKWLTDSTQNDVSDVDPISPGYKFFCNSSGHLNGILLPRSSLSGPSVQKILQLH